MAGTMVEDGFCVKALRPQRSLACARKALAQPGRAAAALS